MLVVNNKNNPQITFLASFLLPQKIKTTVNLKQPKIVATFLGLNNAKERALRGMPFYFWNFATRETWFPSSLTT